MNHPIPLTNIVTVTLLILVAFFYTTLIQNNLDIPTNLYPFNKEIVSSPDKSDYLGVSDERKSNGSIKRIMRGILPD